jgi:hypothetical protein
LEGDEGSPGRFHIEPRRQRWMLARHPTIASRSRPYGVPSFPSTAAPLKITKPRDAASAWANSTSRDLPLPAMPSMKTAPLRPRARRRGLGR